MALGADYVSNSLRFGLLLGARHRRVLERDHDARRLLQPPGRRGRRERRRRGVRRRLSGGLAVRDLGRRHLLTRDSGDARGWTESAWSGSGSGCSIYEPKPAFQTDTGCADRAVADVSAVADPDTPVAVYDSYQTGGGWLQFGGTSVASPIIASRLRGRGHAHLRLLPELVPVPDASALNDVTSGSNGTCTPAYLCTAGAGYDGPTGLGTPDGLAAFHGGPHGEVEGTVSDSNGAPIAGAAVSIGGYSVTTDADGAYQLVVPAGTYNVTAQRVRLRLADRFGRRSGRRLHHHARI